MQNVEGNGCVERRGVSRCMCSTLVLTLLFTQAAFANLIGSASPWSMLPFIRSIEGLAVNSKGVSLSFRNLTWPQPASFAGQAMARIKELRLEGGTVELPTGTFRFKKARIILDELTVAYNRKGERNVDQLAAVRGLPVQIDELDLLIRRVNLEHEAEPTNNRTIELNLRKTFDDVSDLDTLIPKIAGKAKRKVLFDALRELPPVSLLHL